MHPFYIFVLKVNKESGQWVADDGVQNNREDADNQGPGADFFCSVVAVLRITHSGCGRGRWSKKRNKNDHHNPIIQERDNEKQQENTGRTINKNFHIRSGNSFRISQGAIPLRIKSAIRSM